MRSFVHELTSGFSFFKSPFDRSSSLHPRLRLAPSSSLRSSDPIIASLRCPSTSTSLRRKGGGTSYAMEGESLLLFELCPSQPDAFCFLVLLQAKAQRPKRLSAFAQNTTGRPTLSKPRSSAALVGNIGRCIPKIIDAGWAIR